MAIVLCLHNENVVLNLLKEKNQFQIELKMFKFNVFSGIKRKNWVKCLLAPYCIRKFPVGKFTFPRTRKWGVKLLLFIWFRSISFHFIWACDFYISNKQKNKIKRMFDSWMISVAWVLLFFGSLTLVLVRVVFEPPVHAFWIYAIFIHMVYCFMCLFYECIKTERKQTREWKVAVSCAELARKLGVKIKPPNIQFYGW